MTSGPPAGPLPPQQQVAARPSAPAPAHVPPRQSAPPDRLQVPQQVPCVTAAGKPAAPIAVAAPTGFAELAAPAASVAPTEPAAPTVHAAPTVPAPRAAAAVHAVPITSQLVPTVAVSPTQTAYAAPAEAYGALRPLQLSLQQQPCSTQPAQPAQAAQPAQPPSSSHVHQNPEEEHQQLPQEQGQRQHLQGRALGTTSVVGVLSAAAAGAGRSREAARRSPQGFRSARSTGASEHRVSVGNVGRGRDGAVAQAGGCGPRDGVPAGSGLPGLAGSGAGVGRSASKVGGQVAATRKRQAEDVVSEEGQEQEGGEQDAAGQLCSGGGRRRKKRRVAAPAGAGGAGQENEAPQQQDQQQQEGQKQQPAPAGGVGPQGVGRATWWRQWLAWGWW